LGNLTITEKSIRGYGDLELNIFVYSMKCIPRAGFTPEDHEIKSV